MAVSAMSFSRGLHSNHCKSHSSLWEWRVRHVELHGASRSPLPARNPCLESAKRRVRRGTSAIIHCKVDSAFGDGLPNFSYGKMLSEISSWGIGGPAKMFVEVTTPTEMASVLRYCKSHNVRWFVVGKGSNCLFDDRGFDGCIILNRIDFLERLGQGLYRVGSGYAFNMLGVQCSQEGFSGLEFAGGIPGTVGGAVYMNAGADGQMNSKMSAHIYSDILNLRILENEGHFNSSVPVVPGLALVRDVVENVEIVRTSGVARSLSRGAGELKFEYRSSLFQKMSDSAVIVAVTFELEPNSDAKQRQRMYLERRKRTQPVSQRSAGCVFRNPGAGCESAGALIEQAGLKGVAIGGARISEKHANFLINGGGSKSRDMQALIALVKEQVHEKFGLWLHDEVLYVPYRHES